MKSILNLYKVKKKSANKSLIFIESTLNEMDEYELSNVPYVYPPSGNHTAPYDKDYTIEYKVQSRCMKIVKNHF